MFLLHASDAGIEANQGIENREDVAAVFHHTREHVAQARFTLSLPGASEPRREQALRYPGEVPRRSGPAKTSP